MKKIKSIAFLAVLFFTTTAFVVNKNSKIIPEPQELNWLTDFDEARKIAEKENKIILAFFTGSDWCGWCIRLQKNVFAKPAFKEWANKNVVLLELDFPRRKQLPEKLKQQNYQLQQAFGVRGYPTVWLFNAEFNTKTNQINLNPYGSSGYPAAAIAGKEEIKFIADMNAIISKK